MHARLAQFEGDPGALDQTIEGIRRQLDSGETPPSLEAVHGAMLRIDRESGRSTNLTFA